MNLFNRAIRIFLIIASAVAAVIGGIAWFFSRLILSPPRLPVQLPKSTDVPIEQIEFPAAQDGLRISGWLMPQARGEQAPVMILLHGWPWNRLGEDRQDFTKQLLKAERVDILSLAHSFHAEGYAVLMFDLRNHGQSASAPGGMTFGLTESFDLLGAIDYLEKRSDVDMDQIGVTGFSMGANAVLFSLARTEKIKAAVAVQPTTPIHFATRLANYFTGPFGMPVLWGTNFLVKLMGGSALEDVDMVEAASQTGQTPLLYVQSAGDQFGSVDDVQMMAAVTPNLVDVIVTADGEHRYAGYNYVINNPEILHSYFRQFLS